MSFVSGGMSGLSGDVKLWAFKITAALRLMVDALLRSENALRLIDRDKTSFQLKISHNPN